MKKISFFFSLMLAVLVKPVSAQAPAKYLPGNSTHQQVTVINNSEASTPGTPEQKADVATGIAEIAQTTDATVYPNPTNENININLGEISDDATVGIYSATGQLLISQKIGAGSGATVNLKGLAHGMYYVSIKNGGSLQMRSIVKN